MVIDGQYLLCNAALSPVTSHQWNGRWGQLNAKVRQAEELGMSFWVMSTSVGNDRLSDRSDPLTDQNSGGSD